MLFTGPNYAISILRLERFACHMDPADSIRGKCGLRQLKNWNHRMSCTTEEGGSVAESSYPYKA